MRLGKRDMNFAGPSNCAAGKRRRKYLTVVWLPLLLALMMGLGFGTLKMRTLSLAKETKEIAERVALQRESAGNALGLARSQRSFCQKVRTLQTALERLKDTGMTGEMIEHSLKLAGDTVFVNQVSVRKGRLVLSARTEDYREAGLFVERLRDSGLFSELDYEGFQRVENGYTFVVECAAAEEDQDETQ